MINTFEKPAAVEAESSAAPDKEQPWYWCPTCHLASSKPGSCAGCSRDLVAAPENGIPPVAYTPKARADRSRRTMITTLLSMVGVFVACAFGIFMLATHGASSADSSTTAADGGTVDNQSAYNVPSLHGTVHLKGAWGGSMLAQQLPASMTNGAQVKSELSVSKGSENIVISSFLSSDPSGVLNSFVSSTAQTQTASDGSKVTMAASRDVSIAGYTAVAQDREIRNAKGGLVSRGTMYVINAGSRVVVITASVPPAQENELAAIEQALTSIG